MSAVSSKAPPLCSCRLELCRLHGVEPPSNCARAELLQQLAGRGTAEKWAERLHVLHFRSETTAGEGLPLFREDPEAAACFFEGLTAQAKPGAFVGPSQQLLEVLTLRVVAGMCKERLAALRLAALPGWLRECRGVALAAVRGWGQNLAAVGARLQTDPEIIEAAVASEPSALRHLHVLARQNADLLLKLRAVLPATEKNQTLAWLSVQACVQALPCNAEPLLFDAADLTCPVCLSEFMMCPGATRMCLAGHRLCEDCLTRLVQDAGRRREVQCPTCRVPNRPEHYAKDLCMDGALQRMRRACPNRCSAVLLGKAALLRHLDDVCPERKVRCPVCTTLASAKDLKMHLRKHQSSTGHWTFVAREITKPHQPLVYGAGDDCVLLKGYFRRNNGGNNSCITTLQVQCLECEDGGEVILTASTGFGNDLASEIRHPLHRGEVKLLNLHLPEVVSPNCAAWVRLRLQRKRRTAAPTRRQPDVEPEVSEVEDRPRL